VDGVRNSCRHIADRNAYRERVTAFPITLRRESITCGAPIRDWMHICKFHEAGWIDHCLIGRHRRGCISYSFVPGLASGASIKVNARISLRKHHKRAVIRRRTISAVRTDMAKLVRRLFRWAGLKASLDAFMSLNEDGFECDSVVDRSRGIFAVRARCYFSAAKLASTPAMFATSQR
jgi:hypothetical protein